MNPLSPLTYASRHKVFSLALTAVLALTVAGLYLFIGLAQATYIAPAFAVSGYLSRFNLVQPEVMTALDPVLAERIRANPDVAQVFPQNDLRIKVANIGGANFNFRLIGLREADAAAVLAQSGVHLKEGRLPAPGTNEVALSEEIAAVLKLTLGQTFDRTTDEKAYTNIVSPLRLTGILAGDVRLGLMSYEFLAGNADFETARADGLLVIARPGRGEAVESYLLESVRNPSTKTYTYRSVSEQTAKDQKLLYVLGLPIVLLVSAAITLVIGAVNRLAFARRLAEFGTLYAMGHRRQRLAVRLAMETAAPAALGWVAGIALGWAGMGIAGAAFYAPRGFGFGGGSTTAMLFTVAVPLTAAAYALMAAFRALGRMDPIAVVERGQLTLEGDRPASAARNPSAAPRPLASSTYYRRHASQAMVMIGATLLLILGTGLLFFIFSAGADALKPSLNNLSRMSAVSPNNQPLDPALIGRIRENPAVERVIDVYAFSPLRISIPPMFPNKPVETLCVNADDMAFLVGLYGLELAEGKLPLAGTNEVVIPWALAQNRDLRVGEIIGDPAHPAYPGAPSLPAPIVVSGIFAPSAAPADETWLSFMSLEYVDQLRESELSLIVVPRAGRKAELDSWLENGIAGEGLIVLTFATEQAALDREMGSMLFTFSLMEFVVALVAAIALAGLQYLFAAGREAEWGILSACGWSRRRLAGRILREMLFTIGAAWAAGLGGCLAVMLALQYAVFASIGLSLNFFNPAPWLATLPIPAAALAAGAGLTLWMLSRLDPIAVIERRNDP